MYWRAAARRRNSSTHWFRAAIFGGSPTSLYGTLARQSLDIYTPIERDHAAPVVIFFHGGNWQTGTKSDYLFVGAALASRGFIVVIPDYRLYPEVRYPAFLEDGASAVSWTLRHLDEIGGDPDRVHLMGHSAGAYIAAMLALDERWLGEDRARVHSTWGWPDRMTSCR